MIIPSARLLLVGIAVALSGCRAQGVYRDHAGDLVAELDAVAPLGEPREELLLRLGLPSAQFEAERILCWKMALVAPGLDQRDRPADAAPRQLVPVATEIDAEDPRIVEWREASYSLVVVFGEDGRALRRSMVRVR